MHKTRAGSELPARDTRRTARVGELREGAAEWIAGRLLRHRDEAWLVDESGAILLEFRRRVPGAGHGDLVEVRGKLKRGLFHVLELGVLVRAVRPWPERPERSWQRWLEDAELRRRIRLRAGVLAGIRRFFDERGFLEVETPALVSGPGMEPHLEPFSTILRDPAGRSVRSYLHTSPEYAMKKLLCGGMERIFQVCRVFRNAELARSHQPEFTMLEWYRAYATYEQIQADCEQLVVSLARALLGGETLVAPDGRKVDLAPPFERLSVAVALERYSASKTGWSGPRGEALLRPEAIRALAEARGLVRAGEEADFQDLFFQLLLEDVEPHLGAPRPTLLVEWPAWQGALARVRGEVAERVELYIAGVELANGFTELTDPHEQRRRFEHEREERRRLGREDLEPDEEFLAALEWGMPPAGGIALGVDRLVALLAGTADLQDVTLLPFQERFA